MFASTLLIASASVTVRLSASVRNPDIRALAISAGWSGADPIALVIDSGVDVATLSIPNTIPAGVITLTNNGRIGGVINSGTGLTARTNITVINNGTIFGGGGRGGDGGNGSVWLPYDSTAYHSDQTGGSGGNGQGFSVSGSVTMVAAGNGGAGTSGSTDRPGTGSGTAYSGAGGDGGTVGNPGSSGSTGSYSGSGDYAGSYTSGQAGALAGYYIDGNAYVTWLVPGTRLGRIL